MIPHQAKATPPLPRSRERRPGGEGPAPRLLIALVLALLSLSMVHSAHADGEVGLVIEENGQVRTYCIAFEGDSISGDDLLTAADLDYEDLGGGAGAVLCAIEEVGCFNASSFSSCWCECQGSGGDDCVYWAFFTRDYDAGWVYSARAFDRIEANDGDVHAWRWGPGGPNSAPRPSDSLTFEAVCGHSPRGGAPPPQQATSTPTLPSESTPTVTLTGTATSAVPSVTDTPFTTVTSTALASPEVSVTFSPQPTSVSTPRASESEDDEGGSPAALIGFGAIAVVLLAAIGVAAYWRRSHGA